MGFQWWCVAGGTAWSWTWRPYPGVWLFIAILVTTYWLLVRRSLASSGAALDRPGWRTASFAWGAALLWLALDWPLGALGAGYLASAHMLQFLIIALAAPPLLLLGVPRARWRDLRWRRPNPILSLLAFNAVVIGTHVPVVSDTLMTSQAGSFLVDMLWLSAGLFYWLPVVAPGAPSSRFNRPVKMVYLFGNMVLMTAPGAMITFATLPLYRTYELAPPIGWLDTLSDQRLAGLIMRVGAGVIIWTAISVLFVRWNRSETRLIEDELRAVPDSRARPRA